MLGVEKAVITNDTQSKTPTNDSQGKFDIVTDESRDDEIELSVCTVDGESKDSNERLNDKYEIDPSVMDDSSDAVEKIDELFNNLSELLQNDSDPLDISNTNVSSQAKSVLSHLEHPSALSKRDEVQLVIDKYVKSKKKNHFLRKSLGMPTAGDMDEAADALDVNISSFKELILAVDEICRKEGEASIISHKVSQQACQLQSLMQHYQKLRKENEELSSSARGSSVEGTLGETIAGKAQENMITNSETKENDSTAICTTSSDTPNYFHQPILQIDQAEPPVEVDIPTPEAAKPTSQKISKKVFFSLDRNGSPTPGDVIPAIKSPKVLMALEGLHKAKIINDKFDKENKDLKKRLMMLEVKETQWKSQLEEKERINNELSLQVQQLAKCLETRESSYQQQTAVLLDKIEEQSSKISKFTDDETSNKSVEALRSNQIEVNGSLTENTGNVQGSETGTKPVVYESKLESISQQDKETIEELKVDNDAYADSVVQNAEYQKYVKEYQLRIKVLEGTVAALNNRIVEMKMDTELKESDERRKQELEIMESLHHEEVTRLQSEKVKLEDDYKQAEEKIIVLETDLKMVECECARYSQELQTSQDRTKVLESTVSELENQVLELQSQKSELSQQVSMLMQSLNSSKGTLETSQNKIRTLECSVSDLKQREIEQDSLCKEMGEQNFQLCREMENLTQKVNKTLQSYSESRNEIKTLQNALSLISSKHQSHIEEVENAATALRLDRDVATAHFNEVSSELLIKRQQLDECQNGLTMLLNDLASKKKLMKEIKESFMLCMRVEEAELKTVGIEIGRRVSERFDVIKYDMNQLRSELKTERQKMDVLKIEFNNKLAEKEAEFTMRENNTRIRLNDIIESKNRQIHTLEEDAERIFTLATTSEQNEQYLKQELVNAEESLTKLKAILAAEEAKKQVIQTAWLKFEEQLDQAKTRVGQIAEIFGLPVIGYEGAQEGQVTVPSSSADQDIVQKIESSTSLISDLVLKLDVAYPHSERLKQTEKQLADEAATLHGIIQSMSANFEKATDQVDEKQQLLDSLTEENNDLKLKLAEKLAQEEHAAQALICVSEEKSSLETTLTECKNENERLHNNIAAEQAISSKLNLENDRLQIDVASERAITSKLILENDRLKNDIVTERNAISELNIENEKLQKDIVAERTITSKLQLENEELIKSRTETEVHYRKMLEDAINSTSELQERIEILQKENEFWASANTLSERERSENNDLKGLLREAYSRLTEAHARVDDALSASSQDRHLSKQLLEENENFKRRITESDVLLAELRKQLDDSLKNNQVIQRKFDEAATSFEKEQLQELETAKRTIGKLEAQIEQLKHKLKENSAEDDVQYSVKVTNSNGEGEVINNEASQDELLIASPENIPLKDDLFQAESKVKELESLLIDIKKGKSNDRIQRSLSRATARIAFLEEDARKSKEISDASLSALRLENLELSDELRDAKIRIKHLERISETGETAKQLTKEVRVLKSKYRKAQDALKSNAKAFDFGSESGNQSADDKAMKMEKMLKESYATIENQRLESKTLHRRLKALEREVELLNTQAVAAGGRNNEIHVLRQEKDRLKQNLAVQEQELTTILGDLKKCKLKNQKLREQIFTLKEQLFDAEKAKERVVDQELRINSLQRDKEEMKVQMQSMRQQLKDYQARKKALEKELTENTSFLLAVKEKLQAQNQ